MPILAMAVDSGGEDGVTDNAYKFWRQCRRDGLGKRVYLIKVTAPDARKSLPKRTLTTQAEAIAGRMRVVRFRYICYRQTC